MFAVFVALILYGYPVALSFALTAVVFICAGLAIDAFEAVELRALSSRWFGYVSDPNLLAVPFFVYMGAIFEKSGQAERLLNDAMSEFRGVGPWFLSATQNLRAIVAVRRGEPDDALAWVRESLTHIRDLQDKFSFVYAMAPLAAAAALKGNDAWAARILGARDAVSESTGAKGLDVDALREQAERTARARLGPDRWAQAYAAGRRTSIDALLNDIDSVV